MKTIKAGKLLNKWLKDKSFYSINNIENGTQLKKNAEKNALKLFRDVSANVPAYKKFLRENKIDANKIKTIRDFTQIPQITKDNYIEKYNIKERCWRGSLDTMHIISTSSGTTGNPHFWPRNLQTEIEGAYAHEYIFREICHIHKKNTLLINGFAMGNWIAGTFTLACSNLVAWKGYPLTIMTPGYSVEAVTDILQNITSSFDQVIITGHVPFLKELIENAIKKGVNFKSIHTILLGTGQGITENWRSYMLQLLQWTNDSTKCINLYGSADTALMGFETEQSISIRKYLSDNPQMSTQIFKDERLPSIYTFDPRLTYFEEKNQELLITKNGGCPLVRYNIHDRGGLLDSGVANTILGKQKYDKTISRNTQLLFVYLFGREKFMVKIYGANVYTEHVQQALNHPSLQSYITGRFILEIDYDHNQNPQLICRVELRKGTKSINNLIKIVEKIFVDEVRKLNTEYDFVLKNVGEKTKPKIIFHEHGHKKYFPEGAINKTA